MTSSGGPVLLDTGILYAYYDRTDTWHGRARRLVEAHSGSLLVPAPVIPEVDHLLGRRLTAKAQEVFWRGLAEGDYVVADLPHGAYARVLALNRQFADLHLGFVDAAIVAIAESVGLTRIGTTDRRHFGPLAAVLSLEVVP
jgi:predicted nucleic acid-binding protein